MFGELLIGLFCCIPSLVVGIPVAICASGETNPAHVEEAKKEESCKKKKGKKKGKKKKAVQNE